MKKYIRMQQFFQICMNLKIIPVIIMKDLLALNDLNNIITQKINHIKKNQSLSISKIENILVNKKMFIHFFSVSLKRQ